MHNKHVHDDNDKIYIINRMMEKYTHQIYIYNKEDDDKLCTHNKHNDRKYTYMVSTMMNNIRIK